MMRRLLESALGPFVAGTFVMLLMGAAASYILPPWQTVGNIAQSGGTFSLADGSTVVTGISGQLTLDATTVLVCNSTATTCTIGRASNPPNFPGGLSLAAGQSLTSTGLLGISAGATSTWKTTAGTLNVDGNAAINLQVADATVWSLSATALVPSGTQNIGNQSNPVSLLFAKEMLTGNTAAAADTAGQTLTITTQKGGPASATGGGAGGALTESTSVGGDGSAGLAAGHGGDYSFVTGGGGVDNGSGGNRPGNISWNVGASTNGTLGTIGIGNGTNHATTTIGSTGGGSTTIAGTVNFTAGSIAAAALTATGVSTSACGDSTHVCQVTPLASGQVSTDSAVSIATMTAASAGVGGAAGFTPASSAGDQAKFLRADATWQTVSGTGTVTSITCGSTMTCSANPITTTATIDHDLTHANDWTGKQRFTAGTGSEIGPAVIAIRNDDTQTASTTGGTTTGTNISIGGNTLTANGHTLRIVARWSHAANTNSATISVVFGPGGGSTLCQATSAVSNAVPQIELSVTRQSSSTYTYHCTNLSASYSINSGTITGVDFTAALVVKTTTGATTANADATTAGATVEWIGS